MRTPLPTNDLAPAGRTVPVAISEGPSSLLDVILRAGSDPAFDVEKFERLVQIQRSEQDRQDARADREAEFEAEAAFNTAMSEVQKNMGRVAADADNTSTRSRYASYGALDRVVRPLYTEAGFRISFNEDVTAAGADMVRVLAYVTHTAPGAKRSHSQTFQTDIPSDGKGARGGDVMSKTHAHVSATSYGKRVLLGMIFNIATGSDDDGNRAGSTAPIAQPVPGCISAAQKEELRCMLEERGISERSFLHYGQVARLEDIKGEKFVAARDYIKKFRRAS